MQLCKTSAEVKQALKHLRQSGEIALVPTMGYFHEGHQALIRAARKACPVVVVSIFVNPLQFGPAEDFAAYPRDIERDLQLASDCGVDLVFAPRAEELCPPGLKTKVSVSDLDQVMCGQVRPAHFQGVATIVAKLFHIIAPQKAFFGEKDIQQLQIIRKMKSDLHFDLDIIGVPTVREDDGLAMSSRNIYLKPEERRAAAVLSRSLREAREQLLTEQFALQTVHSNLVKRIQEEPLAQLEYAEILALPNLTLPQPGDMKVVIAVACRFGQARLIDNVILTRPQGLVLEGE